MRKNVILGCVIGLVALLLIVLIASRSTFKVEEISYDHIIADINKSGASLLYTKDLNKDIKKRLKDYYKEYKIVSYYSNMDLDEINKLVNGFGLEAISDHSFILFMNGDPVEVIEEQDEKHMIEMLDKHLYNVIPESEIKYQVLSTASEYIKKVNSNKYTVAVFGRNDCTYCDLYLMNINNVAGKYNTSIYYFNRDEYDEDEYDKIMDLDFEIPSKCTGTGYPTSMKKSFPKPMTIITKKGEFVDCIKGYVTEEKIVETLKEYKIVKE